MPKVTAVSQAVKSLANKEPVKNHYSMDSDTIGLLHTFSKSKKDNDNAKALLIDDLFAKGYKPYHFVDMRETEDKQGVMFRDAILGHIVDGWEDDDAKKLYYADPKTLSQTQLALQAFHQNEARITYNNMKGALKTRCEKGDKKTKAKQASQMVMALREIKSAIKRLKDETKNPYAGIADDIKALQALKILAIVKDTK